MLTYKMDKVVLLVTLVFGEFFKCNGQYPGYRFYRNDNVFDGSFNFARTLPRPSKIEQEFTRREWLCLMLGICTSIPAPVYTESPKLKLVYQWKQLEFDYKSTSDRQSDINDGTFTPGVIAPIDVDVFYSHDGTNDQIFVTIPKFVTGIPATLGTVSKKQLNGNPLITPYPDWSWHRRSQECRRNRIVSVFRTMVDECNRLWVLDTGKVGDDIICRPQLLAFDLNTNQVVHRHEFSNDVVTNHYLLVTPVVDVRDPNSGCQNTFVYSADVLGFALLVYDVANDRSWRIQDKTFYPFPTYGTYTIAGDSFDLMDGVVGMSLSPYNLREDRILFYHAMSSATENWVYTSRLRNGSLFQNNSSPDPQIFNTYRNTRNTQSAAEAIDKDGIMFFGLMTNIQLVCWNTKTDYGPKNFDVIANDPVTLQFLSGVKIIRNRKGEQELWIMSSRFQKIGSDTLNPKETNFRIQAARVDDLLYGSKCRSKLQEQNHIGGYGLYGPRGRNSG